MTLLVSVAVILVVGVLLIGVIRRKKSPKATVSLSLQEVQAAESQYRIRIKVSYFRENWGAPFIIGFMALLLVSATGLSLSQKGLANDIAIYAFYLLVVGVILQIVSYAKHK